MTPIYKSTYKNLQLEFSENFDCYNAVRNGANNGVRNQKDIISGFSNFYKSKNLEEIRNHVSRAKPFIPKIIKDITNR
jgi:hypothetical protein